MSEKEREREKERKRERVTENSKKRWSKKDKRKKGLGRCEDTPPKICLKYSISNNVTFTENENFTPNI